MNGNLRLYLPLAGFVLPTLVVGYGFVIPASCIRGVNELSVGFGTTVLGAALAYLAGIRAATATTCPRRTPLAVRFTRYLNAQASHPRGAFGWLLGILWSFEHRRLNRRTLDLLEVRATDHVLDLGCGPGTGVREASKLAVHGQVTGADVSAAMLRLAERRNQNATRAGRVRFQRVNGDDLELLPDSFDRIFSVHSIYFWTDAAGTLKKLAGALRPGGRVVLAFRPDDPSVPDRFRDESYRFYAADEVRNMALSAGLRTARLVSVADQSAVWLVAEKEA